MGRSHLPLLLVLASTARLAAAAEADGPELLAARAAGAVRIDGRLDEADWARAEPFAGFQQVFPGDGVAPTEDTEVRVLLGAKALYVGVRCDDRTAAAIVRPLGRRDHAPESDIVTVLLDTGSDRRSAVLFSLTAGGVQSDALVYDDDRTSYDWDAPWDGAVQVTDAGWTAELAIPLSALRYQPSPDPAWGFGVIREIARTHEKLASFPMPRDASGMVAQLGTLGGLGELSAASDVQVTAYAAQRLEVRPQFSDASRAQPRLTDASADLGVDVRAGLGRMSLTGTLNPDFGQVEADEVILNLSSFESFFPEKRPFFTEGADAFQPVGGGREQVPQQLFYSRRVGIDAPILGAVKVAGEPTDRLKIGVLDAVVMGAGQPAGASEESPDRSLSWSPARPFSFAPVDANPLTAPVPQNFFAAVARLRVTDSLAVGVQGVSALPVAGVCTPALDAAGSDARPAACDARGGDAIALDFDAISANRSWYAYGQLTGSRVEGGPPERTLRDGTVLRRNDLGAGTYLRAGKRGGRGFRFDVAYTYADPRLDLNAAGFQQRQNEQEGGATLKWAMLDLGAFHELTLVGGGYGRWSTDGHAQARGWGAAVGFDARLKDPYLRASFRLRHTDPMYDAREIAFTGIALRRPPTEEVSLDLSTDPARTVSGELGGYVGRSLAVGPLEAVGYHGVNAGVAIRPHQRLETRLVAAYDRNGYGVRFLEDDGADLLTFGALRADTLSLTLRQLLVLTPRLTFQLYGQLFTAFESWGPFFSARAQGTSPIEPGALAPTGAPADGPDSHTSALVLNAVLRWEYRLGSTLYLVYARNQTEAPLAVTDGMHALAPRGLGIGPTTDSFLVKWSYRFAR
jgi:hypothetical protein